MNLRHSTSSPLPVSQMKLEETPPPIAVGKMKKPSQKGIVAIGVAPFLRLL